MPRQKGASDALGNGTADRILILLNVKAEKKVAFETVLGCRYPDREASFASLGRVHAAHQWPAHPISPVLGHNSWEKMSGMVMQLPLLRV